MAYTKDFKGHFSLENLEKKQTKQKQSEIITQWPLGDSVTKFKKVNTGSGNGLVLSGNKPSPQPSANKFLCHTIPQTTKS